MIKSKKIAIKMFLTFFKNKYKLDDIKFIKKIHHGFTNTSFCFIMNDNNKYQVRIGNNNDIVNRNNEYRCLNLIHNNDYLYYDIKNGNAIKIWIKGRVLNKKDLKNRDILNNIFNEINQYHSLDVSGFNILRHDYYIFLPKCKLKKIYLTKYKKIVEKISTTFWGFSHNDLNLENILISNNNKIKFIDFEWSRINHPYWDFANLIKETIWKKNEILIYSEIAKLDYFLLLEMSFVAICFSYQWTFSNSFSLKILCYRLKMYLKMKYFYNLIK